MVHIQAVMRSFLKPQVLFNMVLFSYDALLPLDHSL